LIIVDNCAIDVALRAVSGATLPVRFSVFEIESDGLIVVGNRSVVLTLVVISIAADQELNAESRTGIELDDLIVVCHRAVVLTLDVISDAAIQKRITWDLA
jgi:hypothetical protein